jgi:DsbC/DsbD-like thiol-disulfide interchange protein
VTVNNRTRATILAIFCVLAAACSNPAGDTNKTGSPAAAEPTPVASTNVVKVNPAELTLTKGESGTANVKIQIQNGYHVNANPPSFSYLIPTKLEVTPAGGISAGDITYPDPVTKTFSFADAPLKVYEGETTVKAVLKADASAPTGKHNLSAKMRVQACDDQVCYPPGTIDLTIPVTIK